MKLFFVALVYAAILASTGAAAFPKDDFDGKDYGPAHPNESKGSYNKSPEYKPSPYDDGKSYETGKHETSSYTKRDVDCAGLHPWQLNRSYNGGDQVVFNALLWTAKWWNYNTPPNNPADVWSEVDNCIPTTIGDPVDCTGVSFWDPTVAYPEGSEVRYFDHHWLAVQWTTGNSPGDASGTWWNIGTCSCS